MKESEIWIQWDTPICGFAMVIEINIFYSCVPLLRDRKDKSTSFIVLRKQLNVPMEI